MFKPIIHNLDKTCVGYKEVKDYNRIISNKKLKGLNLEQKIESERKWIDKCNKALELVNKRLMNQ